MRTEANRWKVGNAEGVNPSGKHDAPAHGNPDRIAVPSGWLKPKAGPLMIRQASPCYSTVPAIAQWIMPHA
jgi:hypothetical protein